MNTRLLYLGILWVGALGSRAQAPGTVVLAPVSSFFTEGFKPAASTDSLAYCAETTFRDSLSGVTKVYYPSGYLKQYAPFADVYRRIRHGTLTTWYEDGRMQTKEDYLNGQRHGELLTYYPGGTLKRREQYVSGRSGVGTCFGPDGQPIPYFGYEQLPLYPEGNERLMKELTRGVRLDAQELGAMRRESALVFRTLQQGGALPAQLGWKRQVDVELAVAENGQVMNARVVMSATPFLNYAVLRSVEKLTRRFVPARRDGKLVASLFVVPVYYTLETISQRPASYRPPGNQFSRMLSE